MNPLVRAVSESNKDNAVAFVMDRVRKLALLFGWSVEEVEAVAKLCADVHTQACQASVEIVDAIISVVDAAEEEKALRILTEIQRRRKESE